MRQVRGIGKDDLLREHFDSVFRRNLVEPDAPREADKKRYRKAQYKFKDRNSTAYGTLSKKLDKKNKKLKDKNDKLENKKGFLKDDLIYLV